MGIKTKMFQVLFDKEEDSNVSDVYLKGKQLKCSPLECFIGVFEFNKNYVNLNLIHCINCK